MGSSTGTLVRNLNGNFDEEFDGNLDRMFIWKTNKKFDWKGGIWRREMKSRNARGKGVGGKGTDENVGIWSREI